MKIRNKNTGQIHEVLEGTLYAKNIFEKVNEDDRILVGEPTVEYEIEKPKEEAEPVEKSEEPPKSVVRKKRTTKRTKKGAKNGTKATKSK